MSLCWRRAKAARWWASARSRWRWGSTIHGITTGSAPVHASKELNVYQALPTLFLSNDHTGSSELCTLFLDPQWRKEGNGYLLSKSRFLFMAAFRERFNEKVVAEMRGVIDEQGYSPFWESWANAFRHGVFPCRLPVRHRTEGFHCRPDAQASAVYRFPFPEAQAVIGKVHPQTAPARTVLERGVPLPELHRYFRRRPDSGVRHRPGAGDPQKPSGDHRGR